MLQLNAAMLVALLSAMLLSCESAATKPRVHYRGALRTMMHDGDLRATVALDTLQSLPHLYGLGAGENLKGEVLIYESAPFIATVEDSTVVIKRGFAHQAALLVYAHRQWREFAVREELQDADALEAFIIRVAKQSGFNIEEPFPFLLSGTVTSLAWHVTDWPQGDTLHTHAKHKASGRHGRLERQAVEILGFYSDQHHGIFTHRDSNMHLHVKTAAGDLVAHVDDLKVNPTMRLYLPK